MDLVSAWVAKGPVRSTEVLHIVSGLARSGALDPALCDQIAACSLQCVPHFNARSIATVLSVCSQSGCTHVEFLESLGKAARPKIAEFSIRELREVSIAAVKLSLAPILGSCIPAAVMERVSDFKESKLALMMYAVSKLSDNPREYLNVLEHAILKHVPTLTPVGVRCIAMSWAKAPPSDQNLIEAVAARTFNLLDDLDASAISHIAWAYSKLPVSRVNLFKALGVRCAATVSSFGLPHLGYTALAIC